VDRRRGLALVAGAVLAGCATGAARVTGGTPTVEKSHPPEGAFLEVDGRKVHAVVRGAGPDLVLIHGSNGNTRDFTFAFMDRMSDRYRVIALDRPGHGYSDPLPRDQEDILSQARHLQAAAETLGASRPLVLGQSYGGAVALAWAVERPETVAGLISVAGVSHPWEGGLSPFYRLTSNPIGAVIAVPAISAFASDARIARAFDEVFEPQAVPEGYLEHFGPGLALRPASMRLNARQRAALKGEVTALVPRYVDISVPVEVVHGTADRTVYLEIHARQLARDVPGTVVTELPGIGHMPHHVAADAVEAAIDRVARRAGLL